MTFSPVADSLLLDAPVTIQRGYPMRWHLVLFGVGVVIPMLAVAGIVAMQQASSENARSLNDATQIAQNVADDIDRELDTGIAVLQALSYSPALRNNDFAAFDGEIRETAKMREGDIVVRNLSGRQVVSTRVLLGEPLPTGYDDEARRVDQLAIKTRQPVVSNLFNGNGGPLIALTVPVVYDGATKHLLAIRLTPERILRVLLARQLPEAFVSQIIDDNYKLIARSDDLTARVGNMAAQALQRDATGRQGSWSGISITGIPISGAYVSTKLANWRIAISVPTKVLEEPWRHSLAIVAALGAVGLALSLMLALVLGRQMSRPIQAVAAAATALGRGETVAPIKSGVREIGQIGDILSSASQDLRRRAIERDQAQELLRQSEERVRRMTEEALQRTEKRLRLLIDAIADYAILMLDPLGRVSEWSKGAERITGYGSDEIIGQSHAIFYTPDDAAKGKPAQLLERAGAEGKAEDTGWRVRKDGKPFWAEVTITPIFDSNGALAGYSKVTRDLTTRQKAEQKFKSLLESAPDAIIIIDRAGAISIVNSQTEKLFGYTRKEMIGEKIELLMPDRFHAGHPAHRDSFFEAPQARPMGAGFDLFGRRKDGSEFPIEISLSPIETENGVLVSSSIRDITERKEQAQKLQEQNVALEEAVKELDAFSYSVSHDLRAPLRAVDGFSRILLKDHASSFGEEARDYLVRVHDNAVRMGELVDDLLRFSRLSRQPLNKRRIKPNPIVEQIVADEQQLQGDRSVELSVQELPPVLGDAGLIKQIFVNLISNAFKYSRKCDPAVIEIGSYEEAGETVYFVRDNGAGFDMQYADKLFSVFTRLHRLEDFSGTGVGLAIVKRIIDRHGGRIWANAEVNKGATFFFTIEQPREGLQT